MRELDELGERFWAWRARQQPRTRDDLPRLDRPPGWLPEVDGRVTDRRREELGAFRAELNRIRPAEVADRIDHRLLRSALARVEWESEIVRLRSIPRYWVDQALGPVFDALLRPGRRPAPDRRGSAAAARSPRDAVACAVRAEPARPGVRRAGHRRARRHRRPRHRLRAGPGAGRSGRGDQPAIGGRRGRRRVARIPRPADEGRSAGLPLARPVGRRRYEWFLREVACVPLTVDEIADIGRREYERAAWLELLHTTQELGPARAGAPGRRQPAGPGTRGRPGRRPPVLRRPGPADPAGVAAALPHPADAGLPRAAALPRRE